MDKMKKNRIKKFLTVALAVGVLSTTSVIPAFASVTPTTNQAVSSTTAKSTSLSKSDKDTLNKWMKQYGVDDSTREALIAKYENGQLWDSITNSKSPTKIEKLDDNSVKRTYADGSISISSISGGSKTTTESNGSISINSVGGGTSTSGSGYINIKGATVSEYQGVVNAQFLADYTLVNGGMDYITKVYNKKVVVIGGAASGVTLTMIQKQETLNDPAEAELAFDVTVYSGGGSANGWLQLFVGNNSAYDDWSF